MTPSINAVVYVALNHTVEPELSIGVSKQHHVTAPSRLTGATQN